MPFERIGAFRSGEVVLGRGWEKKWGDTEPEGFVSSANANAERLLDYSQFAIRVNEADIERLDVILNEYDDAEIRKLQNGVARVRHLFSYDVPDQPADGTFSRIKPRRNETNATTFLSEKDRFAGDGAADVANTGDGVGTFPGAPWDAFEMIMASLRYKLELRKERRDVD